MYEFSDVCLCVFDACCSDYCSTLEGDQSYSCWRAYFELKELEVSLFDRLFFLNPLIESIRKLENWQSFCFSGCCNMRFFFCRKTARKKTWKS